MHVDRKDRFHDDRGVGMADHLRHRSIYGHPKGVQHILRRQEHRFFPHAAHERRVFGLPEQLGRER